MYSPLALYVLLKIKSSEPLENYMLRLQQLKFLPLKLHLQVCVEWNERLKCEVCLLIEFGRTRTK